ncbi:hypothetical protein [Streptomyces sp. R44]|uniref:N-acetyltransferase domain-containing protein n=1 Tax=Streptomyces sp. R44 TaxID=3238633 RepID=A0AB39SZE6_9ACTN
MINDDEVLGDAVRNNAEWCQSMCRAHGLTGTFGPRAWTSAARTPLYYPDAVTLTEDAEAGDFLAGIDRTAWASVKDSYARVDLEPEGFQVIVDAQWIARPAGLPTPAAPGDWRPVRTPAELAAWALAWSGDDAGDAALFRPELLADPATTIVAGRTEDGRILGGAVLSASARVTGVSNLFTGEGADPAAIWAGVLASAPSDRPVVGYESGEDLAAARAAGFRELGALRVWLNG